MINKYFLLCVIAQSLLICVDGRPQPRSFFDIPELLRPQQQFRNSDNSRRAKQSYATTDVNGRKLMFEYDVTHAPNIFNLFLGNLCI